ncbi:hypothetical protein [Altererythrobacter sp.]|uniref:hypothetical protein n=1 Tax=Altererythrobacter sp. TaxID=1872480 RepID=UPI003D08AF2D
MSAIENPDQFRSALEAGSDAGTSLETLAGKWIALHETAQSITRMAALAPEEMSPDLAGFPARMAAASQARLARSIELLDDIEAMLQPGLAALKAIEARGQDTTAPALALWREYYNARKALLQLCSLAEEAWPAA